MLQAEHLLPTFTKVLKIRLSGPFLHSFIIHHDVHTMQGTQRRLHAGTVSCYNNSYGEIERMQVAGTPEQITALYSAIIMAQMEFPSIAKTKEAYNYKYAPLPEIHEKIRPILSKHSLAVFHPIIRTQDGKQSIGT